MGARLLRGNLQVGTSHNIEASMKWWLFYRQHFQMHFVEWKCFKFQMNSLMPKQWQMVIPGWSSRLSSSCMPIAHEGEIWGVWCSWSGGSHLVPNLLKKYVAYGSKFIFLIFEVFFQVCAWTFAVINVCGVVQYTCIFPLYSIQIHHL